MESARASREETESLGISRDDRPQDDVCARAIRGSGDEPVAAHGQKTFAGSLDPI